MGFRRRDREYRQHSLVAGDVLKQGAIFALRSRLLPFAPELRTLLLGGVALNDVDNNALLQITDCTLIGVRGLTEVVTLLITARNLLTLTLRDLATSSAPPPQLLFNSIDARAFPQCYSTTPAD